MKKLTAYILSVLLILTFLTSCNTKSGTDIDENKITVVTTVFPVYDWTRNVVGDRCNIIYLDKSGTDMHSFEPTANDILTIAQADIFIHIGGVSDKWVSSALSASDNKDIKVLSLIDTTGVLEEETVDGMQIHEHNATDITEYDEHIWLSLKKAAIATDAISNVLSEADKDNASHYRTNADSYINKLNELDKKYSDCVNNAERNTLLFADRFPFRYLTEDYGIEYFAAFPGCSAESEASFDTLASLIEKTKNLSLPVILTIENSTVNIAETISKQTGAKILTLNSCQSVAKADIESGLTYLSAMENNLKIISEALN